MSIHIDADAVYRFEIDLDITPEEWDALDYAEKHNTLLVALERNPFDTGRGPQDFSNVEVTPK